MFLNQFLKFWIRSIEFDPGKPGQARPANELELAVARMMARMMDSATAGAIRRSNTVELIDARWQALLKCNERTVTNRLLFLENF